MRSRGAPNSMPCWPTSMLPRREWASDCEEDRASAGLSLLVGILEGPQDPLSQAHGKSRQPSLVCAAQVFPLEVKPLEVIAEAPVQLSPSHGLSHLACTPLHEASPHFLISFQGEVPHWGTAEHSHPRLWRLLLAPLGSLLSFLCCGHVAEFYVPSEGGMTRFGLVHTPNPHWICVEQLGPLGRSVLQVGCFALSFRRFVPCHCNAQLSVYHPKICEPA